MNFYDLVKLLHVEAELISMFKYLLCVKKLKRSLNTKYHALHAELFSIWDRFRKDGSKMTPADLLDACADLYSGFNSDNFKASADDAKDDDFPPCVPQ